MIRRVDMRNGLFLTFLLLTLSISAWAIPARKGTYTYTQPDGRTISVTLHGDEFSHISTTTEGYPITRRSDGWYCYASFDSEGHTINTDAKVGIDPPQGSTLIPYAARRRLAAPERAAVSALRARTAAAHRAAIETKAPKTQRGIVILAQFSDLKFKFGRDDFDALINRQGYSVNGATGSAVDYFTDMFEGKRSFKFDVTQIVTLSRDFSYYGENDSQGIDKRSVDAVIEACRLVDGAIDFSNYDQDGDGCVDDIFVFFAGGDEAEGAGEDHIWSQSWAVLDGADISVKLDGVYLNNYAMCSELSWYNSIGKSTLTSIGTFCHEYSHVLGLPDLYDTDYEDSGGESDAMWFSTSLMDGGNFNNDGRTPPHYNAIEMEILGLSDCASLKTGSYTLSPVTSGGRYMRLDGDVEGDYYLFECRALEGWDKYIGGSGMLIYHIDKSDRDSGKSTTYETNLTANERWMIYNEVNCRPDHQCADLVEASSKAQNVNDVFWPNGAHKEFSYKSTPQLSFWSGATSDYSLIDITKDGNNIRFSVTGILSIGNIEAFQDAAIIQWTGSKDTESCTVTYGPEGGASKSVTVRPYATGLFSCTLEGLDTRTNYTFEIRDSGGETVSSTFATKAYYTDGYPFIYLNSATRNADGSFVNGTTLPLRVYNAAGARRVRWYLDNQEIKPEGNGYYPITRSGTLKAVVDYSDGTTDIISKSITVR